MALSTKAKLYHVIKCVVRLEVLTRCEDTPSSVIYTEITYPVQIHHIQYGNIADLIVLFN